MINGWSRVYPYCKGFNYQLVPLLINHRLLINPITNSSLNWLRPVNNFPTFSRRSDETKQPLTHYQNHLMNRNCVTCLNQVILTINQGFSYLDYHLVKPVDVCINLDASMASRVNKQAAKRKHASKDSQLRSPQVDPQNSAVEETAHIKHVWGESPIDEDGCSIVLDPVTLTASFHAKIRRCASPGPPGTSLDTQADDTDTNSMLTESELITSESTDEATLTLTNVGGVDIFEAKSASINTTSTWCATKQSAESDSSMCQDCPQHVTKSPLTTEDEELGIDPSLLRHTLERSRSLGDATRAQDASKDRSLKGLKAKKRKRKGTEKVEESSAAAGDEGSERKTKRLAPNFFVAVQVSNPQIHEALKDVQQTVVSGDEKLKDAMVPISTLHLTIMVMHLATEEDVERAKVALNECHRLLSPRFIKEKLSILFGGLGHFNNQVMFAKIKDQDNILESLYEIADTVEKCFSEYQLVSTGERGFKPHLTVMKLSRAPSLRKKGVRRIKSELYKAHSSQVFGTQVVEGLQLCSINKPKTPDGYYCKAAEVFFGDPTCRPDRDIHTIAEGEEPAIESLNEACSSATNMSESTDTRSSPKRVLETEEKMDCNDGEASVKTQISDSPKYEHMSSNEKQNISLDVKHQSSSRPICESVVNNENSVSKAEVQKGVCLDSDTTQDTPSGATSDTPFASLSDTGHNGPSDTADSTLENMSGGITSDTTPTSLSDVSAIEPSALLNGERKSTESAMDCGTVQRGPGDVLKTGPTETC
ncbi:uncharacterized protein LOC119729235 isoform X2 [Patiria miniata]|uniref:A-kinase anchor protein 7-like phosphoesterase domain-containing protein n=1 Tax=Patiria miniata TaxID=46514 RepID=A0A914A2A4_PATMI|nr:uncharacterized protein LOC119729235 isoform X2 [Patiria miniata]